MRALPILRSMRGLVSSVAPRSRAHPPNLKGCSWAMPRSGLK
jgi:hypothetical protein